MLSPRIQKSLVFAAVIVFGAGLLLWGGRLVQFLLRTSN